MPAESQVRFCSLQNISGASRQNGIGGHAEKQLKQTEDLF